MAAEGIVTIVVGLLTPAVTYLAVIRATGRFEGSVSARLDATEDRITKVEAEQRDQWKQINDTRSDVGELEGRMTGLERSRSARV